MVLIHESPTVSSVLRVVANEWFEDAPHNASLISYILCDINLCIGMHLQTCDFYVDVDKLRLSWQGLMLSNLESLDLELDSLKLCKSRIHSVQVLKLNGTIAIELK